MLAGLICIALYLAIAILSGCNSSFFSKAKRGTQVFFPEFFRDFQFVNSEFLPESLDLSSFGLHKVRTSFRCTWILRRFHQNLCRNFDLKKGLIFASILLTFFDFGSWLVYHNSIITASTTKACHYIFSRIKSIEIGGVRISFN